MIFLHNYLSKFIICLWFFFFHFKSQYLLLKILFRIQSCSSSFLHSYTSDGYNYCLVHNMLSRTARDVKLLNCPLVYKLTLSFDTTETYPIYYP